MNLTVLQSVHLSDWLEEFEANYISEMLLLLLFIGKVSWGSVVQITRDNIERITEENNLVLINFYADWCRYRAFQ